MFLIRRIDEEIAEADEWLGSKPKFWFTDNQKRMLFKGDERGTGEDWAEMVACQLSELLGLPHVHYELAALYRAGDYIRPGVVCESCAPNPPSLVLGNQLLLKRDPDYPAGEDRRFYRVRQHTVAAVADVLQSLLEPASEWMVATPAGIETALEVFSGFIMLDAWIANQDRHHGNWGALQGDDLRLAPTFDHGAALARNISDDERKERLTTKDKNRKIDFFARHAWSAFYSGADVRRPLGTLEAFYEFAGLVRPAAKTWIYCLEGIDRPAIEAILGEIPDLRMTDLTKEFTLELLMTNRKRLLDESSRL